MKLTRSKLKEIVSEVINESDFPITTKKDKTVTVVHKTSGKELVVIDTPSTRKKYNRMDYFVQADASKIKKAIDIAKKMGGNMTGAVKRIEKIEKNLSNNHKVAYALKTVNESINEYSYGVGDIVKDINPTCPHNGAVGKVKSVNPKSVVFVVTNKGKNYDPGDVLDKTHDQMKKESINEAGIFDDYHQLNPAYMDKFIKNYKKLNSKNLVKKKGGDVYGFRKGEREAHWKFDDDYKLYYDIDKTKALVLINSFNRVKQNHPWG